VTALAVMPLGATLRELHQQIEHRIRNKSYRASPIGQQVGRWLRALRWADASPNTLDSYEGTLARLALEHDEFSGADGFCTPVGTEYIRDFLDRNWGQSAPATRRQRLAAVKSFFTWAMAEGLCGCNPAAPIKAPKARGGGDERIAYAVPTLLHLVRSQPTLRDQCALQLLCRMALRKNELRLLRVRDVDLVRNLIVVHGKGGGTYVMPLEFKSLRDDLYLHIQGEQRHLDEYLIYPRSRRLEPMDPASVHRWFKRCLERAGLPTTIKTHEMRHSAADAMWRGEGDIVKAQQLLRHASVRTTQDYLHPTRADLAAAMRRQDEGWR
jgi:site-specific recombinase XerD